MMNRRNIWGAMVCSLLLFLVSCAKMGNPDGGWYDEEPPRVIGCTPEDKGTNVKAKKIYIYFNEFVKIENATEKVVVSPPQLEMPEIKGAGKRIIVELMDSLKENTTYTVDFSDAISDNNEGNPLGNYTYSFSTGNEIDTMEVSGYVLEAMDLEPIKGILVGLYDNLADSAFRKLPMLRVSRTDSRGHFVIKGVKPGNYRAYALQDMDGDYAFSQKSEKIAFSHDIIVPSSKPDIRRDTVWRDSLHIDSIMRVPYTHFLPDDIALRAFTEVQTDRYFLKSERKQANMFTLVFTNGADTLPTLRGLNFDERDAFVIEPSEKMDTITYWIRDSLLINQDSLDVELTFMGTDTAGVLRQQTDTLLVLSKDPYEKRMKKLEKEISEWNKKKEKAEKKGEPFTEELPQPELKPKYNFPNELDPDKNPTVSFETPVSSIDTTKIHLYSKHDTLWYNAPCQFVEHPKLPRTYILRGEWRPEIEYSIEIDSAAFTDIYGTVSKMKKQGMKVKSNDAYSTIIINISGMDGKNLVAQLLTKDDKPVKEVRVVDGMAEFFYVNPGTYYLRAFEDDNGNGVWDTGSYDEDRQAEIVYYYHEAIECKEKWDVTQNWSPRSRNGAEQKPGAITKQKAEKQKSIKRRNFDRARELGLEYIKGMSF